MVLLLVVAVAAMAVFVACGDDDSTSATKTPGGAPTQTPGPQLSGSINGDGSSTVFPISEAVAEEFRKVQPGVDVVVGIAGTGGGFKKICNGETDFNDASRPVKDAETQACAAKNIELVEFQVAFDGLSVLVNPANDFAECLTVAELKSIWQPGSTIKNWKDVRAGFPDMPLTLYGPDTDSGTFDYFTEVINGEAKASRPDYTASADDNTLVQGIAGDDNALGYFGFAYYEENQDKLKLLGVDAGSGCVQPSRETILDESYAPLSRPLFVYVRGDALERPEVKAFMRFYLENGKQLVGEVGYVEAPDSVYQQELAKLK
ncbi:MAG: PstS family phosphate ABC transporter substrate-binding protein [Dehalococcoidia bacterium]|nr:PstS family phosphate ABC transporter substrate-binding protein [Dehalococcoidia bacterium]